MKLAPRDISRIDGNYATAFIDSAFPHIKLFVYILNIYILYVCCYQFIAYSVFC